MLIKVFSRGRYEVTRWIAWQGFRGGVSDIFAMRIGGGAWATTVTEASSLLLDVLLSGVLAVTEPMFVTVYAIPKLTLYPRISSTSLRL